MSRDRAAGLRCRGEASLRPWPTQPDVQGGPRIPADLELARSTESPTSGAFRHCGTDRGGLAGRAFQGRMATGFRGFYVNEAEVLKRPLICVNTATHPTVVAAAFWHEIGHHLSNRIWGARQYPSSLAFSSNDPDRFTDPKEIAADMVRVLGGYPRPMPSAYSVSPIFKRWAMTSICWYRRAIPHMRAEMGFDFQSRFSAKENLYYLGGIIQSRSCE